MSKNETVSLFVAGIIFAGVLAGVLKLSLIDTAQAIQIIISFVLVLITAIYVKRTSDIAQATRQQADASVKMAEEMRNTMSPYITIRWGGGNSNSKTISAHLENEGYGSALNLTCYLSYKGVDFNSKLNWSNTFPKGEKYSLSLDSENFDFKAWNGLAINCVYGSFPGGKFHSILRCESEEKRSLEIIKLNSGGRHD